MQYAVLSGIFLICLLFAPLRAAASDAPVQTSVSAEAEVPAVEEVRTARFTITVADRISAVSLTDGRVPLAGFAPPQKGPVIGAAMMLVVFVLSVCYAVYCTQYDRKLYRLRVRLSEEEHDSVYARRRGK